MTIRVTGNATASPASIHMEKDTMKLKNALKRRTLVFMACGLLLACLYGATTLASSAYAYEFEYYDDAGNQVGLRGYECGIGYYRWGRTTENVVIYDYGPCW